MNILWVKSGGLVPLNTGGKIRSFNLLRQLARRHQVTLFLFYGAEPNDGHGELRQWFTAVHLIGLRLPAQRGLGEAFAYARNLFSHRPYTVAKYCRPEVSQALRQLLKKQEYDVIVCDFLFAADAIPWDWPCPKVLFTHNVEEQIWRRHYQVSHNPIWKAICWREYRKIRRVERHYVARADEVLAVSDQDRRFFGAYADLERVTVVPTGVDTEYFMPGKELEEPNTLIFTGSMDWMPNEDAIFYFVNSILPRVRREIPDVRLWVVGRSPSQKLKALGKQDTAVRVVGAVDDIRPFVTRSSVYVVPLRIGGGTRIKIFEALAMAKAVVSTTIGAEGLPVNHGEDLLLADDAQDFADRIIHLLRNPDDRVRLGTAGRRLVEQGYSWASVTDQLEAVLERAAAATRRK